VSGTLHIRVKSSKHRGRLYRALRYRLIIPMLRARHGPEYVARGTMIGLALAFTPTIGFHTVLAFAIWAAARFFNWRFSLILAVAWTWVSNVFTAVPIYYLLYATGQIMRGHYHELNGYAEFLDLWQNLAARDRTLWQEIIIVIEIMLEDWGIAMCLGSIPWAAIAGGIGYWVSLTFIRAYRRERAVRRERNTADRSRD
jgi:uncharacterized protein